MKDNLLHSRTTISVACQKLNSDLHLLKAALSGSFPANDWKLLLDFGRRHHMLATWFQTNDFQMRDCDEARQAFLEQWRKNHQSLDELKKLCGELDNIGVRWVVLKGLPLAHELYGDIGARPIGDVDLLVASQDWERVVRLLESLGYTIPCARLSSLNYWRTFVHALQCRHPKLKVDLHHNLRADPSLSIDPREVMDRAQKIEVDGWPVWVPHARDTLLLLILGLHDDLSRGTAKVRSFLDLEMASHRLKLEDCLAFQDVALTYGALKLAVNVLHTLERVGGAPNWSQDFPHLLAPPLENPLDATPIQRKVWAWRLYNVPLACAMWRWLVGLPVRRFNQEWGGAI
jgi:hypothetical protein